MKCGKKSDMRALDVNATVREYKFMSYGEIRVVDRAGDAEVL
jgi:hypothetical protein